MGKCWVFSVSFCNHPALQLWSLQNVKCAYYATPYYPKFIGYLKFIFHPFCISFYNHLLKFIPKNLDFLVLRTGTWVKSWAPFARHGFVLSCAVRSVCSVGEAQDLRGKFGFEICSDRFSGVFWCKTPNFWCWISGHEDKGFPAVFQARGARGARSWIWRHGLEVWYFNLRCW